MVCLQAPIRSAPVQQSWRWAKWWNGQKNLSDSLPLPMIFSQFLPSHPQYLFQVPVVISPKHSVGASFMIFIRFHPLFSPVAQGSWTYLSTFVSPVQYPVQSPSRAGLQVMDEDGPDIWLRALPFQGQIHCNKTEVQRMNLSESEKEHSREDKLGKENLWLQWHPAFPYQ